MKQPQLFQHVYSYLVLDFYYIYICECVFNQQFHRRYLFIFLILLKSHSILLWWMSDMWELFQGVLFALSLPHHPYLNSSVALEFYFPNDSPNRSLLSNRWLYPGSVLIIFWSYFQPGLPVSFLLFLQSIFCWAARGNFLKPKLSHIILLP